MRRPLIAGNWKMNTTVDEAVVLVKDMLSELNAISNIDRVLCPPFISLQQVSEIVNDTSVAVGAQNMYFKERGAFTGEISPLMLKRLCKYVILGHSERRQFFGETDTIVNEKLKAALAIGLLPIFCIGESLQENEATHHSFARGPARRVLPAVLGGGAAGGCRHHAVSGHPGCRLEPAASQRIVTRFLPAPALRT